MRNKNSEDNGFSNNERNQNKCDALEDGTAAFMKWMGSSDKESLTSENAIVLIKLLNVHNTLLYDTDMSMPVQVKMTEGYYSAKPVNLTSARTLGLLYA
jgi:hypothetical protein